MGSCSGGPGSHDPPGQEIQILRRPAGERCQMHEGRGGRGTRVEALAGAGLAGWLASMRNRRIGGEAADLNLSSSPEGPHPTTTATRAKVVTGRRGACAGQARARYACFPTNGCSRSCQCRSQE